ncbi:hypothetical protein LTR95_007339 [Oleoguttula sp. CCFEE 5521]
MTTAAASDNALSVLLSALPTNVASSIEDGVSDVTSLLQAVGSTSVADITITPIETTAATQTPMTSPGTTPSTQAATEATPTQRPQQTTTPSPSTLQTSASRTSQSSVSSTTTSSSESSASAAAIAQKQSSTGTIAGIAAGGFAALMLLFLLGLFLHRRRKQGRAPFASRNKLSRSRSGSRRTNKNFPESAWLYDPVITPAGARSPALEPSEGPPLPRDRRSLESSAPELVTPDVRDSQSFEPLLAPQRPIRSRDGSPRLSGDIFMPPPSSRTPSPAHGAGPSNPRRKSRGRSQVDLGEEEKRLTAIFENGQYPLGAAR